MEQIKFNGMSSLSFGLIIFMRSKAKTKLKKK